MRRLLLFALSINLVWCHFETANCGKSKKCMFVPAGCEENESCVMMYSYKAVDDGITEMELFSANDEATNNYVAVGFSKDTQMGNDHVTQCAFPDTGAPEVHLSFNFGKSNSAPTEAADLDFEKNNLKLIHAHKDDKGLYCHFSQKSSKPAKQYAPDLDGDHNILLARGKARQPRDLGIHTLDPNAPDFPFISTRQVNVGKLEADSTTTSNPEETHHDHSPNATTIVQAKPTESSVPQGWFKPTTKFFMIKIHGVLMIIAWFFFVALAILSARYLRDHFPSSNPGGLKWWFHIHRTFNIVGVFLILISALLIFLAKEFEWTGPTADGTSQQNSNPGSIHSLLGTIAILISIAQPLMSLLRCAPDTGARPIFNWSHRILGIIGILCGIIAITIAGNSFVSLWSDSNWSFSLIIFYIVILIAGLIGFEIFNFLKSKENKASDLEMHKRGGHQYDRGHMRAHSLPPKKPMFGILSIYILFALFSLCLCTALCIMLLI